MTQEDQNAWHIANVREKIAALKALPEAMMMKPMLERLERRLEDRGEVSSLFAQNFEPAQIRKQLRESFEDHGHSPPANDSEDDLSPRLTAGLEALNAALKPLVKHADYLTQGMQLTVAAHMTLDMGQTGNGPLTNVLAHAHEIDTLDKSHTLFDTERGYKYLAALGIEMPPPPKNSRDIIPLVEKNLAQLEAFKNTLGNTENKQALEALIGHYRTIMGVVESPDTVVPINFKRKSEPADYLASLKTINQEMRHPFLMLYQEYHDEPDLLDPLLSVNFNTMDLIKNYILERAQQPNTTLKPEGRSPHGPTTSPPAPGKPKS